MGSSLGVPHIQQDNHNYEHDCYHNLTCVRVCVCVYTRAHVCLCLSVSVTLYVFTVCIDRVFVCVCVCVCERERERESMHMLHKIQKCNNTKFQPLSQCLNR